MKPNFQLRRFAQTTLFAGALFLATPFQNDVARAQDAATLRRIGSSFVGSWDNPRSGDRYVFRSNGTYTFTNGPAKRATGNVSHSGTWRISEYHSATSDNDSDRGTLHLRATRRVVLEGSRRRTLKSNRRFTLPITSSDATGLIGISGQTFYTKDSPERP